MGGPVSVPFIALYRDREYARRPMPRRSLRIKRTMNNRRRRTVVKMYTDCAGVGMAFVKALRKNAPICAADDGMIVRRVSGGVEGIGAGAY